MIVVKDIAASKQATFVEREEVFLHERFTVATAKHVTPNIDGIARRKEGEDIPAHIQLMVEFSGIGHHLVNLRFHKVRITGLVHIAYIVEVEQRQVKRLRPRFKFRLGKVLEP